MNEEKESFERAAAAAKKRLRCKAPHATKDNAGLNISDFGIFVRANTKQQALSKVKHRYIDGNQTVNKN